MAMPVITEYYAKPGHAEQLKALLLGHWHTLHSEGYTTAHPAFLMQHPDDPELFIEVFEWQKESGPDEAWDNPRISNLWNEIQSHCENEIDPEYYEGVPTMEPGGI